MINLPNEITLSRSVTNKFSNIKKNTGITPNLMGRYALMLAFESGVKPSGLDALDSIGQKIPRDIFFGNDEDIYLLAFEVYVKENRYDGDLKELIAKLVEHGSHSIPKVNSLLDLNGCV